jgi:phosphoribosyl 1,2-cyclic phosphodiesterase
MLINQTIGQFLLMIDQDLVIDAGAITSTQTPEQPRIQALFLTHQHLDHIRDLPTLALGGSGSGAIWYSRGGRPSNRQVAIC